MKKLLFLTIAIMAANTISAQDVMTPETLWKLGRVTGLGLSKDGKNVVYKVVTPSVEENKSNTKYYTVALTGGNPVEVADYKSLMTDRNVSPDGKHIVYHEEVKLASVHGKDFYPELKKSDVQVYNSLDYRHWDTWNEGKYNHVFFRENKDKSRGTDIMKDELFDSPTKPFGDEEDYLWSPDGKSILYVCKKKSGTEYAISTNTDIYEYDIASGKTINRTEGNLGYDTHPAFSPQGHLTWLQMENDGYESDKNDIIVAFQNMKMNLTSAWDGTVDSFMWSKDGKKVYFIAAVDGTKQLFEVNFPGLTRIAITVRQLTNGNFDVSDLVAVTDTHIVVARNDMNHAAELYTFDFKKKTGNNSPIPIKRFTTTSLWAKPKSVM
ncbi:hypothetical protein FLLO111716_12325 [Flavobacterium longum]